MTAADVSDNYWGVGTLRTALLSQLESMRICYAGNVTNGEYALRHGTRTRSCWGDSIEERLEIDRKCLADIEAELHRRG